MDLTWRHNVSRCRNLHRNTRHCSSWKFVLHTMSSSITRSRLHAKRTHFRSSYHARYQTGLNLTRSKISEDTFSRDVAHIIGLMLFWRQSVTWVFVVSGWGRSFIYKKKNRRVLLYGKQISLLKFPRHVTGWKRRVFRARCRILESGVRFE